MKMTRILVQVPISVKQRLDALRSQGYTASSYIRALLERELNGKEVSQNGRQTS